MTTDEKLVTKLRDEAFAPCHVVSEDSALSAAGRHTQGQEEVARHLYALEISRLIMLENALWFAICAVCDASGSSQLWKRVYCRVDAIHSEWAQECEEQLLLGKGYELAAKRMRILDKAYSQLLYDVRAWAIGESDGVNANRKAAALDRAKAEQIRNETIKAAMREAKKGAKVGAREGVENYNKRILLDGKSTRRRCGGGCKASFDVDELQCRAVIDLGAKVARGERARPYNLTDYADPVIRQNFPASDRPFVYGPDMNARACGKVRQHLIDRVKTYCKRHSLDFAKALPLANTPE